VWVAGKGGVVIHSSDGGTSWQKQLEDATASWNDIEVRPMRCARGGAPDAKISWRGEAKICEANCTY
jgi:hypothetical protein